MIASLRSAWNRIGSPNRAGFRFRRPLILFQSDDWGRVGVRDKEGWEELRAAGVDLGQAPYDYYSLETAADLRALACTLRKRRDSEGRHPSIVMNFVMANVDFEWAENAQEQGIPLIPLTRGLPSRWSRPGLFEAYREGIQAGLFLPALHGLTHFCAPAVERALAAGGERSRLVSSLWRAQTPYIHWRMPWTGYEYWDPELEPDNRFLSLDDQRSAIREAGEIFRAFFSTTPVSACAPGYRANSDTHTAWFEGGVRVAQNGPGGEQAPYLDRRGMLHTFRTVEMEPAIAPCRAGTLATEVARCFERGLPAVISVHSINFHSTIRDFRTTTLNLLDELLALLEERFPNLLYVNDADLLRIVSEGFYLARDKKIEVAVALAGGRA
jgi:hypothetical protein